MQFSLKTLFWFVSFSSVVCAVFLALPSWLGVLVLLFSLVILPTLVVSGIVYGRNYFRAFAIGVAPTLLPVVGLLMLFPLYGGLLVDGYGEDDSYVTIKIFFAVYFIAVFISGLTGMWVRWLALRLATSRKQEEPAPASPFESDPLEPSFVVHRRFVCHEDHA